MWPLGSHTVKCNSLCLLTGRTFTVLKVGDLSFYGLFVNQMWLPVCATDLSGGGGLGAVATGQPFVSYQLPRSQFL